MMTAHQTRHRTAAREPERHPLAAYPRTVIYVMLMLSIILLMAML